MRRRQNPRIELHIEKVVVEGLGLSQRHREDLVTAFEDCLFDIRAGDPGEVLARTARVTDFILNVDPLPHGDAAAAGRSIGSALAVALLPGLTGSRTGSAGRADR